MWKGVWRKGMIKMIGGKPSLMERGKVSGKNMV